MKHSDPMQRPPGLILIAGAPRSGTTWLAKIIDSHPDVLYRHEPDDRHPAPSPLLISDAPDLMRRWAADRSVKTNGKRPFFRKSCQPSWQRGLRNLIAGGITVSARLPWPLRLAALLPVPDMAIGSAERVAIKSVRLGADAAVIASALPQCRVVFILRHPCGQVASVMRGSREGRFDLKTRGSAMPLDEVGAIRFASGFGVSEAAFRRLPDAAKYAWSWRAQNEPAYAALSGLQNVHVLAYEDLCADTDTQVQRLLAFCGLDWTAQTQDFVARSSARDGSAGYYGVFRNAVAAAGKWRDTMAQADQDAVHAVVAGSPLARFWPDLDQMITR